MAASPTRWHLSIPSGVLSPPPGPTTPERTRSSSRRPSHTTRRHRSLLRTSRRRSCWPGAHTLEVSYFNGSIKSINNSRLSFTCNAGGVYELHVAPVDEGFGRALAVGAGGKGHWTAWIIDADTKEVLAGKPRT